MGRIRQADYVTDHQVASRLCDLQHILVFELTLILVVDGTSIWFIPSVKYYPRGVYV